MLRFEHQNTGTPAHEIHGLPLPKVVSDSPPEDSCVILDFTILNRASGVFYEMDLQCSHWCLEKETLALRRLQRGEFARFYGLAQGAPRSSGLLDADRCLCLGVNSAEEGICLDYRDNQNSPALMLNTRLGQLDGHARWVLAAPTFGSFMLRYKSTPSELSGR